MSFNLLSESNPVARKPHSCVWCGEEIPKGEKYHARTYIFEGLQSDKAHLECKSAMNKVDWHYYDGGFCGGTFKRGQTISRFGDELVLKKEPTQAQER